MLTGTAIRERTMQAGQEETFFRQVRDQPEPPWQHFPKVVAVRVQRTRSADPDARPIAPIPETDFPDMAAIEARLAPSIRPASHAATVEGVTLFDGRFCHRAAEAAELAPGGQVPRAR